MFYVRIHKLDKATALGPNCGALTLFGDELYISLTSSVLVGRVSRLKKQQKPEKWLPKIHEIDPNR
jgi:hypothetical protein